MVVDNANQYKGSDVLSVYLQLPSQIIALGSLVVTTDKCAILLHPLVVCCLPEEMLRAWQRNQKFGTGKDAEEELVLLIDFLKKEVIGEVNIGLACGGFGNKKETETKTHR